MFNFSLKYKKAAVLNKKSHQSVRLTIKLLLAVLYICLILSPAVFAAPAYVLLAADNKAPGLLSLPQQMSNWKQAGRVDDAQLLRSAENEKSNFELLGIVEFPDEQALQHWRETGFTELGVGINTIESGVLAHLESSPRDSSKSVFLVMQYDVMVPQPEFQDYIDGYQVPEMVARIDAGGLIRYTSYFKHLESTAPWQSLLIVEYRDEHAFEVSADVNSALGVLIAKTDETFNMYKQTKLNIRDKTLTTKASWVELPPSDLAK